MATEKSDAEMKELDASSTGHSSRLLTALETVQAPTTTLTDNTPATVEKARISASTSTSPLSFGQTISTGDPIVTDELEEKPYPILTGAQLIILLA